MWRRVMRVMAHLRCAERAD